MGLIGCDAHTLLEADICFQLSRVFDLTCTSSRLGYYSSASEFQEVSKFWFAFHVLGQMLVMGRHMLIVYSSGGVGESLQNGRHSK